MLLHVLLTFFPRLTVTTVMECLKCFRALDAATKVLFCTKKA